ncbi:YibE/F family protein [Candidatus Shapirobacteria bacterium CG10_big_fil_rev_8_21_14_0_10_38_14]|uniref:YibE/F family protein n=1 Tax=Candidatus Shapirobacteria bacterium CG10_big_fil_rev_8_21_14_0_10_38_14 TaxID=1974483 RepID=A0A2M8L4T6_9BACT|nr:MAG: YibE/F family protein [Candidatus Shapirobacteria bacterium CG10_big_fil_rev_8_21_14_0_10_38_14]
MKKIIFLFFLFALSFFLPKRVFAQEEILEGEVTAVIEEDVMTQEGRQSLYQQLEVLITKGSLTDRKIAVEVGNIPLTGQQKYKAGDGVLLSYSHDLEGNEVFNVSDFVRRKYLLWLFLIFVILVIAIGRWQGMSSLLGLGISFLVIFIFILPQIDAGHDPVIVAITASLLIIPSTFYLSHGVNKKTSIAIIGTLLALILTGFLAKFFIQAARLTGFASEEAGFLQVAKQGSLNIRGLILAGIIIGALGILDDITVAQAAIVQQLKEANPKAHKKELFFRAMKVGRDHIASMVNTLVLVYAGAALPLLLLFINNPLPFLQVINYEIIAEEIIRTLVGSIGLITAVPLTTFLASRVKFRKTSS